jgi:hypothetical protein
MNIETCKACYKEYGQVWDCYDDTEDFQDGFVWCPRWFERNSGDKPIPNTETWQTLTALWVFRDGVPGWCSQSGCLVAMEERKYDESEKPVRGQL